ncbi:pyridoxine/pyridoxamine 5'-phosphate oxidase [Pseudomonas benzenivorans]|uniref:Pyridoxal 5'-phosphate synthase n=1 Tax=Pseudomonas benzenivorans TaxID=556533 RepID=A0ABY5H209_9PSED|nr:pyridoxal 5'-phosphate synthase [Pseudomonas benzenivorans]UTW06313.1 pyridoxal 5'-phosphate synthase [Pseudomonas benzenivorans]
MKVHTELYPQALERLQRLIDEAAARGVEEPHTAALATADRQARPSVRTVYIVAVDEAGLLFFANRESGKGQQLRDNPQAALCFYWPVLQEQVQVEGSAVAQDDDLSDQYWRKCSRMIQLGAWASDQGQPAKGKPRVHQQARQLEQAAGFEAIPRPASWCAFRVLPERIEFWPTGWQRLRERLRYQKEANGQWVRAVLNP